MITVAQAKCEADQARQDTVYLVVLTVQPKKAAGRIGQTVDLTATLINTGCNPVIDAVV